MMTDLKTTRQRDRDLADQHRDQCPKSVETLEEGLEGVPSFPAFVKLVAIVRSNSILERLNKEIRRRTRGEAVSSPIRKNGVSDGIFTGLVGDQGMPDRGVV